MLLASGQSYLKLQLILAICLNTAWYYFNSVLTAFSLKEMVFCLGLVIGVGGEEIDSGDKPGTAVVFVSVLIFGKLLKRCFYEVSLIHARVMLFSLWP